MTKNKEVVTKLKFDKFVQGGIQLSQRSGEIFDWDTGDYDHPFFKESGYVEVKLLVEEDYIIKDLEVLQELLEDNPINMTNYVKLLRGIYSLTGTSVNTIYGTCEAKGIIEEDEEQKVLLEDENEEEFTVKVLEWKTTLA